MIDAGWRFIPCELGRNLLVATRVKDAKAIEMSEKLTDLTSERMADLVSADPAVLGFDPVALGRRYRQEDLGYIPTRNYVYGPELLAQAHAIGRKFDFYRRALFHTELTGAAWDSSIGRWKLTTDRGDRLRARHVVFAHGAMTQPKLPNIPGTGSTRRRKRLARSKLSTYAATPLRKSQR
jgi:hypothetical protein